MYRMLRSRHPWLVAAVAAALLLGVGGGAAIAAEAPYSLHLKVAPKTVPLHTYFRLKFKGVSHRTSVLVIFLNAANRDETCAADAATARTQGALAFSKRVKGRYSGKVRHFSKFAGEHHACAYLTAPSTPKKFERTRARSGFGYTVG